MAQFRKPNRELTVRQVRRVEELLPLDHLARFVWATLMALDFGPLEALYPSTQGGPGASPFHPRVLVALWTYAMCQGLSTATGIAKACTLRDDFRWLAGDLRPCDQTLLNFVARASGNDALLWIWAQVLWALQAAGQIDLSVVIEDGTKVRANASPRSFHPVEEITAVIEQLKTQLASKLDSFAKQGDTAPVDAKDERALRSLRARLARAEMAASELERRRKARESRPAEVPDGPPSTAVAGESGVLPHREKFAAADFKHDAQRDVLVCPAGQSLTFVGTYPSGNRKQQSYYRLYKRTDCTGCPLKDSCTDARGRRVKIQQQAQYEPPSTPASVEMTQVGAKTEAPRTARPHASLTDPQALLMLATSEKLFAPSYNADITVTRQGFIVSQFLTQNPTDYHSFERALPAVLDTLGRPDSWIGDGHYGTLANLSLAHQHDVPLYAPPLGGETAGPAQPATIASPLKDKTPFFGREAFEHRDEPDVMICPAKKELSFVNVYFGENGRMYRLYRRSDCSDCNLKARCTSARGRRLKVPVVPQTEPSVSLDSLSAKDPVSADALLSAQRERMEKVGDRALKLRGATCEPVNAQLKIHGLARLHVRGLDRGSIVLTIASIAHNLLKWNTREVASDAVALAA